jgi:glucokinase
MAAVAPWLVFDVGGTKTSAALYDPDEGSVASVQTKPSPSAGIVQQPTGRPDPDALISLMRELAHETLGEAEPEVVAAAMPGPVDRDGTLRVAPPLWGPGVGPFRAQEVFGRIWPHSQIFVLNDVTAAGYRYVAAGASDFSILTVSSAIGNKVFIGGLPYLGPGGHGGEIGHMRIDLSPDADPCDCGGRGHLAGRVSGRGMARMARNRATRDPSYADSWLASQCRGPDAITEHLLADAFRREDIWAAELIREAVRPLSAVLAGLHLAVGIEDFVLIGGFAHALGERYTEILALQSARIAWDNGARWESMIRLGEPDQHDALIGAGFFARTHRDGTVSGGGAAIGSEF